MTHFPKSVPCRYVEVHRTIGFVCMPALYDHADKTQDIRDRLGCPRLGERRQDRKRVHHLLKVLELSVAKVFPIHPELARLLEQRIIYIGDITHTLRAVTKVVKA